MINCPNCGGQAEESANFCVHCGNRMPAACSNCGADNRADSLFCHACGFALGVAPAPALPTAVPCPRCQASNEPRTAFCYSCGYPLGEPAAVQFRPTVPGLTVLEGVPAGFWIRLLAWCIDSVLLVACSCYCSPCCRALPLRPTTPMMPSGLKPTPSWPSLGRSTTPSAYLCFRPP